MVVPVDRRGFAGGPNSRMALIRGVAGERDRSTRRTGERVEIKATDDHWLDNREMGRDVEIP